MGGVVMMLEERESSCLDGRVLSGNNLVSFFFSFQIRNYGNSCNSIGQLKDGISMKV